MAAVNEEELRAKFKKDGLDKVEADLALGLYGDRRAEFMAQLVAHEKQRIADERYEQSLKTPWHQTWWGALAIIVVGGLVVAGVVYWIG